jgi:hypothetical protein
MRDRARDVTLRTAGSVDLATSLQRPNVPGLSRLRTCQGLGRRESDSRVGLTTGQESKANRAQS